MNTKVLITGGAGFIGSNLALKLVEKGYDVTVLDNLSRQVHGENQDSFLYMSIKDEVNFIKGDVCNSDDLRNALNGQGIVVHLAAETGTGQSMYEIDKYVETNIGGTAKLLNILANEEHTVKKIIVASSRAGYGEGKYLCIEHGVVYPEARVKKNLLEGKFECTCPDCSRIVKPLPTDEFSRMQPSSIYGITKYTQEQMILNIGNVLNIPAVALRYQNVYGPGQSLSNPYTGILSIFSTQIKSGHDINVFEDGKESRDFIYIDDAIDATVLSLESNEMNYRALNVGTGRPVNIITVAELLKQNFQSDINIYVSGTFRLGDIRHNVADLKMIQSLVNFLPEIKFEEGIKRFCEWVRKQDIRINNCSASIQEMKNKTLFEG